MLCALSIFGIYAYLMAALIVHYSLGQLWSSILFSNIPHPHPPPRHHVFSELGVLLALIPITVCKNRGGRGRFPPPPPRVREAREGRCKQRYWILITTWWANKVRWSWSGWRSSLWLGILEGWDKVWIKLELGWKLVIAFSNKNLYLHVVNKPSPLLTLNELFSATT